MNNFEETRIKTLSAKYDKIKNILEITDKPIAIILIISFLIAFASLVFWFTDGFESSLAPKCLVVGVVGIVIFFVFSAIANKLENTSKKILAEIADIRKESFENKVARGEWSFPVEKLFIECEEEGVDSYSTNYEKKKIYLIAQNLLKNKIPDKYFDLYLNEKALQEYFDEGKNIVEEQRNQKEKEMLLPTQGKLTDKEYEIVKLAQKVKPLYGIEKRKAILLDAMEKIEKTITAYKEGQEALKTLGIALSNSVQQEKKKDWAILGGIASGIGGAGAGVSVATSAMLENNEIDRRNAQLKSLANKTIAEMYSSSAKINSDIYDLQKELELFKYHLKENDKKVVWEEYDSKEIFKGLDIYTTVKKTKDLCTLQISVKITNNFNVEESSSVTTVVDGTLQADIYYNDDTFVDSVCIPLPLFGVNTSTEVVAYTDMYVKANGEYTVKLSPNKLWIMEE